MDGTIQEYVLDMAADTKKEPLRVKQYDTNSRQARITLKMGSEPWTIPFGCQIHINVRKTDGTLADATCTRIDEHTVLTPITEQMTAVTGTQLGELYFLGSDGDIKSQTFPVVVYEAVMDQARIESSDDFQSLQDSIRQVETSTEMADAATQYATAQGDRAGAAAQRAEDAADSIQAAVDAAANAKACESNAKNSELAAAQTQQEVTDYVESQKAAFVGYSKRESDSQYANALTNSVTGEGGVTVEDAWTAPVLGLDVVGKSEQATTTGAQLLPQPQFNDTKNGITVKTQMDGGISITGTATSAIAFTVAEILLPAGTYILSGLSGLVVGRMYFQLVEISAQGGQFVGELAKVGPVASATVTIDRDVWARAEIKVLSGVTADSICYPMLNAGDTALPWEPYTGGAPSPSPEYPQDIISVGTVSTGVQMLDFEQCLKEWNSKYTQSSGRVYTVNALGAGFQNPISFSDEDIKVTLSGKVRDISGSAYRIDLLDSSGNLVGRIIKDTKTITGMASKIRLNFAEGGVGEYADIMLNAGDTALPWEPYTGGKPSPSVEYPAEVEVGMVGANLLNLNREASGSVSGVDFTMKNGEITLNGTASIGSGIFLFGKSFVGDEVNFTLSDGSYSASGYPQSTKLYFYRVGDSASAIVVTSGMTFTIGNAKNDFVSVSLRWSTGAVFNNEKFRIMLNAGDKPKSWEPYRSTSADITLTEPLRGIGEHRDRIMYRDGAWGIERKRISVLCDGINIKVKEPNTPWDNKYPEYVHTWFDFSATWLIGQKNFLSSHFKCTTENNENLANTELRCSTGDNKPYIFIQKSVAGVNEGDNDNAKVQKVNAWIAEHPFCIEYDLATPTWEPLPAATQQALNELTTYAGTTHLTITAGGLTPDVTLEYVQDTQKAIEQHDSANRQYTDNQIAAIVAALPTAMQAAIVDNQTTKLLQEV